MTASQTAESRPAARGIKQGQKAWKYIRSANPDLSRIAMDDGVRQYTYGQMFHQWERYAAVFTALQMTEKTQARVGLLGSTSPETIFAFYGLNMVGAQVSLVPAHNSFSAKRIIHAIREEKLTDFIITDDFAPPTLVQALLGQKKELGLRNVLLLHLSAGGATMNPVLTMAQEYKYMSLKSYYLPICLDALLTQYGDGPVAYAQEDSCEAAFILHTSGTTSGTGKPVVHSDKGFNAAAACFAKLEGYDLPLDNLVSSLVVDLSNAYAMIDQVHVVLSLGGTIITVPGNAINPEFYRVIAAHKVTLLFCIANLFDYWIKMPESTPFDFSSLRLVVLGGTSVSANDKRRYYDFLQKHGCGAITLVNGYGISELGGACCLSDPDLEDEAIGRLLPGVELRLYDEDKQRYYTGKDAPCEGVLYLRSPSLSAATLDEQEILKHEIIERKAFVCTNDLVRLEEDGRLIYLGRANRYFLNESGIKYESGRVETEIARQYGIANCGIVPVYDKVKHDSLPMLCATVLDGMEDAVQVITRALTQVFLVEKSLDPDQIPARVLIAPELPRNANGKLDLFKITHGEVSGETYTVKVSRFLDKVRDIRLVPAEESAPDMLKDIFQEIAADMKSNLPFNKTEKEEADVKKSFNPAALFNSMNQMGSQMLNQFGQKNQSETNAGNNFSFFGMPQNAMAGMQQMYQYMNQQMNQMVAYMNQMSQMSWQMMQQMYAQNTQMMGQFWQEMQNSMNAAAKAEEAEAPQEEEEAEEE